MKFLLHEMLDNSICIQKFVIVIHYFQVFNKYHKSLIYNLFTVYYFKYLRCATAIYMK